MTMSDTSTSADATDAIDDRDLSDGKVFAPAGYPGAAIVGSLLGLLLLGLAGVVIRDFIVRFGWIHGTQWTDNVAQSIATSTWQPWMWAVAVVLVIVGVAMLWLAVKPRRRTHTALGDHQVMWTRRGDVARRCSASLLAVPGVEHATTVVGRRRAKVTVTVSGDVDTARLQEQATLAVSPLKNPPRVKIRRVIRGKELRS